MIWYMEKIIFTYAIPFSAENGFLSTKCSWNNLLVWIIIFFLPLDPIAAVLLVAKRSQIIANQINMRPPQILPVISGSGIVTVDFDRVTSKIYWADASQKKILSAYQNGTDRREVRDMITQMH